MACWLNTTHISSDILHFANSLCYHFHWTSTIETPNISCFKSHVHILLPRSSQSIGPFPRPSEVFRNKLVSYVKQLLVAGPIPRLEDHPLSAVRCIVFSILATSLHICRPSPPSAN